MSFVRYFVIRRGGRWLVTLDGQLMAVCAGRTEAIETATIEADLMGAMHHDADVVVEGLSGSLEVVWTHGQDPAPKPFPHRFEPIASHVKLIQRGETRRDAAGREETRAF